MRTAPPTTNLDSVRLLVVTQDFPPALGGIQTYLGRLCEALHPLCDSLVVVAPGGLPETAHDRQLPFPVHRVGIHSSWLVAALPWHLPRIVAAERPSHVLYAQWFPAVAPRLTLPCATIVHGRELLNHPLGRLGLRLAPATLRRMDAVIPNSRATAGLLPEGMRPDRIHVVHPGVDLQRFQPPTDLDRERFRKKWGIPAGAPVVVTLARFVPRKGIDTLIEAVALLKSVHPDIRLIIAGEGPDRSRLGGIVSAHGLTESVLFLGRIPREDMPSLLSLGVFALLSRQTERDVEGFGMVLAEAQACGAPVVGAASGGMPEAIGPGAGSVVPPDDPRAAAAALLRYIEDPTLRAQAASAGIEFSKTLSWESRAREFQRILGALAS